MTKPQDCPKCPKTTFFVYKKDAAGQPIFANCLACSFYIDTREKIQDRAVKFKRRGNDFIESVTKSKESWDQASRESIQRVIEKGTHA